MSLTIDRINIIHEFLGTQLYPTFGLLQSGLGLPTPILIYTGHLLYGASMGTFYGEVRENRVRARVFEPGEPSETEEAA